MTYNLVRCAWIACLAGCTLAPLAGCATHPKVAMSAPTTAPWSYRGYKGLQIRTQHWVLYTAATDAGWSADLPRFVEAAYDHYRTLLPAPATSRNLTLYLFANALEWEDYGRLMGISAHDVTVAGQLTGFARKDTAAAYVSTDPARTLSAISHAGMLEYLWLHDAGDAPLWIREGLATLAEGFSEQKENSFLEAGKVVKIHYVFDPQYNARRLGQLRVAMQKDWLYNLDELLSIQDFSRYANPQAKAETYLAQVWALMVYLQESKDCGKGYDQLRQDLAAGTLRDKVQEYVTTHTNLTPGQAALRIYITQDPATLQTKFETWARKYAGLAS